MGWDGNSLECSSRYSRFSPEPGWERFPLLGFVFPEGRNSMENGRNSMENDQESMENGARLLQPFPGITGTSLPVERGGMGSASSAEHSMNP